jgi:hypothetical protein
MHRLGVERIRDYNHKLAIQVGAEVSKIFNTEVLASSEQFANLVDIRLPINDQKLVEAIVEKLLLSYRTFIATYNLDGVMYARLSVHIFNELSDYVDVAKAFMQMLQLMNVHGKLITDCCIQ